jgi:hypothetical protein
MVNNKAMLVLSVVVFLFSLVKSPLFGSQCTSLRYWLIVVVIWSCYALKFVPHIAALTRPNVLGRINFGKYLIFCLNQCLF